jgi:PKD repeat protein
MKSSAIYFLTILLLISAAATATGIKQVDRPVDVPNFLGYVPDRLIVVMRSDAGSLSPQMSANAVPHIGATEFDQISDRFDVSSIKKQFAGSRAGTFSRTAELAKYYKIQIEKGTLDEAVEAYSKHPMVERVERVGMHSMYATPNDSYFDPYQWYHNQTNDDDMDSPEAWNIQTGSSSKILAILDSGTRYYHRDLGGANASPTNVGAARGNMWINDAELNGSPGVDDDGNGYTDDWIGWDFISTTTQCWSGEDCNTQDNDPRDFNGHGTHTAGIVGMITNNGYGMAGVAGGWGNGSEQEYGNGVKVMACRMGFSYNYGGQEYGVVYMDAAAEAFYYAADNGASIASCSWGSSNSGGIAAAVDYFIGNGGLIFVAAGNDGTQTAPYLNSRSDIISVAATDQNDAAASFTTYGTWVDISAPGVGIYSTLHDHTDPNVDYWASMDGTSMACPMAAGVAAMIWSQNPSWTASQVETQLYASADDIEAELSSTYRGKMGAGRVNLYNAVNTGPPPAPVANFSGTPTSGTEPLDVNFSDLSTGSVTSWSWTFGDGGNSTSQNPSHTYTSAGTYNVSLTVTGPGGSDGETRNGYITVNPCVLPTAGFTGSPTSGEVPLNVNFSNSSSGATSYAWTFGDGGTSTSTNPGHTYTSAGTYTVELTATNSCGSDVFTRTSYITVTCTAPTAGFTGSPTSGDYPLNVDFTDQSSGATSWDWTFGDGGTSTAQNPSYTYTVAGTYTVTQTVTNSCGNDFDTKVDYITVTTPPCYAPVADFSGTPTSGDFNLNVSFTDLSTNTPTSWSWTFGDGGTSTAQNPSYTYTVAGDYTVSMTATNSCGSDGDTKTGYITVTEPTGGFCDDFGDGNVSDWDILSGDWTVSGGQLDGYIASGTAFIMSPLGDLADATITVDWTSLTGGTWTNGIVVFGYIDGSNYRVADFRDGANKWYIREFIGGTQYNRAQFAETINTNQMYAIEVVIDPSGLVTVSADGVEKVSYNFGSVQTGQIGLEVNQSHSQYDNFCVDADTPEPPAPTAAFVGAPTSGTFPLTVNFTDQSIDSPTGWSWNFGDGGSSTAQNPGHTYTAAGTYTVTLTATNAYGSDDEVKTSYITVTSPPPPTAEFSGTPTSGDFPLTVSFTDASTGAPTSWSWTFGDGGTSTAQNPSYEYTAEGTYAVSLTATNAYGSDVETKTDYITVTDPGSAAWVTITYDDFESGWGNYSDGGGDCALYTGGSYAHQGSNAGEIRDNSGVASSFYHSAGHNVSGYTDLEVEFWFMAVSMDKSTEDFWLQYYDGSSWQTVATWARTIDFDNGVFYHKVVSIPAGTYNYPTNAQLRFTCDASGNKDWVYIDEIEFRGYGSAAKRAKLTELVPDMFTLTQNYPNPFNPTTTIEFGLPQASDVSVTIYNITGQRVARVADGYYTAGVHTVTWDANRHASGIYFYRLETSDFVQTKKMVLLK